MNITIRRVMEHYEIYDANGSFLFSADTRQEAVEELKKLEAA